MNTVLTFVLAAVAGAGAAAEAINNGTPSGEVVEIVHGSAMVARDDTCVGLPKLCTGPVMIYGYATTLTYLCPETTHARSTVHVTVTKTTTVTPPEIEITQTPAGTLIVVAPASTSDEEPVTTTTVRSTLTQYTTITLVSNTGTPVNGATSPAIPITDYFSATIPTELLSVVTPLHTETEVPVVTIQTSTPVVTSGYEFPTMSPPVINGTTTGIFYSEPVANSTLMQPTPFFPNTTSVHSHYALPTLNVANRAAEPHEAITGTAGKSVLSLVALVFSIVASVFAT